MDLIQYRLATGNSTPCVVPNEDVSEMNSSDNTLHPCCQVAEYFKAESRQKEAYAWLCEFWQAHGLSGTFANLADKDGLCL